MDYEIEFHPVGDASKAGDAISIRYGQTGRYEVMVVDGGTQESGSQVVEHIRAVYGSNIVIKHMVSTHPDSDHASGLREILSTLQVENLWVHGLWTHSTEMLPFFSDKRWTASGLERALQREYSIVKELIDLAAQQGTVIHEPFQGEVIGPFTVLSPNKWAYQRLVPQFRRTPDPDQRNLEQQNMWLGKTPPIAAPTGLLGMLSEGVRNWIDEKWNIELLREGPLTAAENETSTVLHGQFGAQSVLLTGDAGVNALRWSNNFATSIGIDLSAVSLIQVPHHGSRSNVSPSILDLLLGPKVPLGTPTKRWAVVSAPKDDEKHPRKMVMNAFLRRATPVCKTQGVYYRHYSGMPTRPNEIPAVPFDFFDKVEEYD